MKRIFLLFALFIISQASQAGGFATSTDDMNMRQSECINHAKNGMKNMNLLDINIISSTVFGNDIPYYAVIRCHAVKQTVFFAVFSPNPQGRGKFIDKLKKEFNK